MSSGHQRITWRRNIAENFNRLSRVHERYRQTDRQTDDRQTDGRRHRANMNMSSRSLKTVYVCTCLCACAQLLEKYFRQMDEIKTLKEQLRCREKKIRRLEDQLRIFNRSTTMPSASWSVHLDHRHIFCIRHRLTYLLIFTFN